MELSFSYGRALQQPSLNSWLGEKENVKKISISSLQRSKFNSEATLGKYSRK